MWWCRPGIPAPGNLRLCSTQQLGRIKEFEPSLSFTVRPYLRKKKGKGEKEGREGGREEGREEGRKEGRKGRNA
jgi:hypothetical protein